MELFSLVVGMVLKFRGQTPKLHAADAIRYFVTSCPRPAPAPAPRCNFDFRALRPRPDPLGRGQKMWVI